MKIRPTTFSFLLSYIPTSTLAIDLKCVEHKFGFEQVDITEYQSENPRAKPLFYNFNHQCETGEWCAFMRQEVSLNKVNLFYRCQKVNENLVGLAQTENCTPDDYTAYCFDSDNCNEVEAKRIENWRPETIDGNSVSTLRITDQRTQLKWDKPRHCNKYKFRVEYYPMDNPSNNVVLEDISNPHNVFLENLNPSWTYTYKIFSQYTSRHGRVYPDSDPWVSSFRPSNTFITGNNFGQRKCHVKENRQSIPVTKDCKSGEVCQSIIYVDEAFKVSNEDKQGCVDKSTALANYDLNTKRCQPGNPNIRDPACYLYCDLDHCNDRDLRNNAFVCRPEQNSFGCFPERAMDQDGNPYQNNKEDCQAIGCCWHEANARCYAMSFNEDIASLNALVENGEFLNGNVFLTVLFIICIVIILILIVLALTYCCCRDYLKYCCGCDRNQSNDKINAQVIYADNGRGTQYYGRDTSHLGVGRANDGYQSNNEYYGSRQADNSGGMIL